MLPVSEALKTTFDSARTQLAVLEKGVQKLEKKAKMSLTGIQAQLDGAPSRIGGAWAEFFAQLKPSTWAFATRAELRDLSQKVDELAGKVEKLAQGRRKHAAS